ncbi:response regulator, partial [Chloroflexota bacterium]
GYQVTSTLSSSEALRFITSQKFDIIFLDLVMPEIDGSELFSQIRQIDSQVPVAIITGYPDSELMAKAMQHGPFIVMKKPFGSADILKAVSILSF